MANTIRVQTLGNTRLPHLVLLHGWGHHSGIWQPLLADLQVRFCVHLLDLPGYGLGGKGLQKKALQGKGLERKDLQGKGPERSDLEGNDLDPQQAGDSASQAARAWQIAALMDGLSELTLEPAIWCGWSLGGMLATRYASHRPDRVTALVTLAANPVFVQQAGWPEAMAAQQYSQFEGSVARAAQITRGRFLSLVVQGSPSARAELRVLKDIVDQVAEPSDATLRESLRVLHELDNRRVMVDLTLPQLHLYGAEDALVPRAVADRVAALNQASKVKVITGAAHALMLSHPQQAVAELMQLTGTL